MLHRNTALSENQKVSNMTSEVIRRMMHVSEDLPMGERVVVLDRVAQKLANSGYDLAMTRKGLVGGLKGYEKRLQQSRRQVDSPGYRVLHESAGVSFASRSMKKLTGKSSWFKDKPKDSNQDESNDTPTVMTKQEYRKQERKMKKEERNKEKSHISTVKTTCVMFVENTPYGELCSRLQRCEDRKASVTGRRVKMVEIGGSSLGQLMSNRNPWAGTSCGRADCHTCHQGGGKERKEDCIRRNIQNESRFGTCEDRELLKGADGKKSRRGKNDLTGKMFMWVRS